MPNKWTEHIKDFASKKGLSYKEAMKHPDCKASYKSGSGLRGTTTQVKPSEANMTSAPVGAVMVGSGSVGHLEEKTSAIRRKRGMRPNVSAVQDIAGNWVIPPIQTANEMLSMSSKQPSFQSAHHITKKAVEIASNIHNLEKDLRHTPLVPAPTKKGRGRPKKNKEAIQMGDSAFMSVENDNLGLGANAGKHYISL